MADVASRTLNCLIEGDTSKFRVKPSGNSDVVDLQDLVWEKGIDAKHAILAKNLTLWKVRMTTASDSTAKFSAG
jgi:hypothetical protein